MKTLEDAIAANVTADRLRILKTIPAKEYPRLLKAVEETRRIFQLEMSATYQAEKDAQDAMRDAVYRKIDCLDLAEMMASLTKKKFPRQPNENILANEDVIDFLATNQPVWLPKLIHGSSFKVILRYAKTGSMPPPPEGDRYYELLPEYIFVQGEGMTEQIKRFLNENPVILENDLHVIIRKMARKRSMDLLNIQLWFSHISEENRGLRLNTPHLSREAAIRFGSTHTEDYFPLMKVVGLLSSQGNFDIQPLLRTILETVGDVQREDEARNVINAHESLAATPEQSLKLQHDYFTLLSTPHKAVARFSINTITAFVELKDFDALAFVSRADAIFSHASNPLQIAGLKLVRDVAKHHPKITKLIPEMIASALLNPDPKVQAAILAVLANLPPTAQKAIPAALSPYADRIIPSLRSSFEKWLVKPKELSIPDHDQAVVILPILGDRLVPLTSADELPFLANELLSGKADPMRLELFLDGLARFAATDNQKLATGFGAVEARARHVVEEGGKNGYRPGCLESLTSRLILHFGPDPAILVKVSQTFGAPPDTSVWPADALDNGSVWGFAHSRVEELVCGIESGRTSQPLCTPEFALGFIASVTLVMRLRALLDQGLDPLHFDFIQAIARCHPNGDEIPDSSDEASRVLRYRLTGEVIGSIGKPAWWLAAARAREPYGDFSKHPQFSKFHVEGQSDWTSPALWRNPATIGFGELDGLNARKYIDWSDPDCREDLEYDHNEIPVDHLYPLQHTLLSSDPSAIRWRYGFTPGFLDAVIAEDIHHSFHMWSATGRKFIDSAAAVMGELAKRRPPLRHTMQVHLMLALNSPGQAEREAAVDILLQASEDGRLADATIGMGIIFRQLLIAARPHGQATEMQIREKSRPLVPILQLGRVVPLLCELSNHGSLIQIQLRDLLLTALEEPLAEPPKGFPSLLEIVLDLVTAHPPGRKIDLNATWGGTLTGKTKSLATRIAKIAIGKN